MIINIWDIIIISLCIIIKLDFVPAHDKTALMGIKPFSQGTNYR